MKTKPLVLALLVATTVAVSAGSAWVIGRLGRQARDEHKRQVHAELARGIVVGVAKAAVRVLVCRL